MRFAEISNLEIYVLERSFSVVGSVFPKCDGTVGRRRSEVAATVDDCWAEINSSDHAGVCDECGNLGKRVK